MPTGVYPRPSIEERFWVNVNKNGPVPQHQKNLGRCWIWTGTKGTKGYGLIRETDAGIRTLTRAHRLAYRMFVGPIPPDYDVHHVCENRGCVRPHHLIPLTRRAHIRISNGPAGINARKVYCKRGHHLSGKHLRRLSDGRRMCVTCMKRLQRLYFRKHYSETRDVRIERSRKWRKQNAARKNN